MQTFLGVVQKAQERCCQVELLVRNLIELILRYISPQLPDGLSAHVWPHVCMQMGAGLPVWSPKGLRRSEN